LVELEVFNSFTMAQPLVALLKGKMGFRFQPICHMGEQVEVEAMQAKRQQQCLVATEATMAQAAAAAAQGRILPAARAAMALKASLW
jgi:hypothetical protein